MGYWHYLHFAATRPSDTNQLSVDMADCRLGWLAHSSRLCALQPNPQRAARLPRLRDAPTDKVMPMAALAVGSTHPNEQQSSMWWYMCVHVSCERVTGSFLTCVAPITLCAIREHFGAIQMYRNSSVRRKRDISAYLSCKTPGCVAV